MNVDEAIEIVREFNKENRYRDCGKLNNAIDIVCEVAERHKDEKILLTVEEKTYLESILNFMYGSAKSSIKNILVNKIYNSMSSIEYVEVALYSDERCEVSINNYEYIFKGLRDCEKYTLEELGI